ncbi:histidine phosphatase family protein [Rhizobium lentis]|uniref:Putative phosphoglycerate mutase n=1 Tax=Rhizobium lentis TaxID=1138194 RepID=A0A7W8XE36_9HYPH|nr:histidine phosphatase family protein [Rhizobium lentis]MBB5551248.1 putative phosphoglycerate mutase [Rhizobium lentis]MBB5561785.1 putative phosphoglycerate mutase [Rhizobium lentis]MBB5568369.1 putative phosphoglycerate mutase [Rhizobium lentis]
MTIIFLLRHGETIWNAPGRFQGQKDSPLTERGRWQADQAGKLLGRELERHSGEIDVHVSPLGRAKETAARISRYVPVASRDELRLMEVTTGSWDGMSHYEIDMEYPGMLEGANAFNWFFRSPDGETFDAACARVKEWLSQLRSTTIAISHGLTGRLIRGVYLGLSQEEMLELPVPQAGFYRLQNGQAHLIE